MPPKIEVTIAIKALNESKNIARALDSAIAAAQEVQGEVVLADSGSTDDTVAIGRSRQVRVFQLANTSERSCGAGAQLAFQANRGRYFYLMDADMIVRPGFLPAAIAYLDSHPEVAGVGGLLKEQNIQSGQFQILAKSLDRNPDWLPGMVGRLDGGGVYRVSAIEGVGYFANRNLHAFEEFDLAARLRASGWKLARINVHAVDHFSHVSGSYALLWRRLKSGYASASGEVLRAAIGQTHLPIVLKDLRHIWYALVVLLWVLTLAALALGAALSDWRLLVALAVAAILPILALSVRRGSLSLGIYSTASWIIATIGFVSGLLRPQDNPRLPLLSRDLSDAAEVNPNGPMDAK